MPSHTWLDGKHVVGIVDNQFGDAGKGKFVNWLTDWADVTVRGTGGANAGHTVSIGGRKYFLHLVPSGITHDDPSKVHIIGHGVVLDPKCLIDELELLRADGVSWNNLRISHRASLVLPYHVLEDRLRERAASGSKIGTTGRGIGPAYQDIVGRLAITANDLLNPDILAAKVRRAVAAKIPLLQGYDQVDIHEIMLGLNGGKYYRPGKIFNVDEMITDLRLCGQQLSDMICDTDLLVQEAMKSRQRILLEGAQGFFLSYLYGTYPYVTSSDCSIQGLAAGAGLTMRDVDDVLGITKAPYMTRVGRGPFPTEMGGQKSSDWCDTSTQTSELPFARKATFESDDEFMLGMAIRMKGGEYGTTTGRARRVGWLDLPLLRRAMKVNGPNLALTLMDVLDECPVIRICTAHTYTGSKIRWGGQVIDGGHVLNVAIPETSVLERCTPVYQEFPGWLSSTSDARRQSDLPDKLWDIVRFVEEQTSGRVRFVSVGPDRDQTVSI